MQEKHGKRQRRTTPGGLSRVTAYLHPDEMAAVEELARRQRSSLAAAVRQIIRAHFGIED